MIEGGMHAENGPTRFAGWGRRRAWAALAIIAAMIGGLFVVASTATTRPSASVPGETDADLFRKVVGRVHGGVGPYDAFEQVFREYEYPVRSVFNYRPPLLYWLLGRLPGPRWGQAILAALMLVTALSSYEALRRRGGRARAATAVLLMQGAFAYGFVGDMYLYTEVWAGTLIALSICAYGLGRPALGTATGLLALFVRELALPYSISAGLIAWRRGRRREAAAWGAGLALFGASLLLHILSVAPRLPRDVGLINGSGWVQFGGPAFLLATCRINLLLLAAPAWVSALYLPLSLVGIVGWRGEISQRVGCVVGLYLAAFSVLGGLFNAYWGLLYAPLLPFGLVWAPASLRDLWSAGFRPGAIRPPARPGSCSDTIGRLEPDVGPVAR